MQTQLTDLLKDSAKGREAQNILLSCVHCSFCNATCPTYQLQGDELDGPRGRIYLIKQILEGETATAASRQHLDRCLSCRSCETTCPSGVSYGRLLDLGREIIETQTPRPWRQALVRRVLLSILPYPQRFTPLLGLMRGLRPLLPKQLRAKIPLKASIAQRPKLRHQRRMLLLEGCVQPALAPNINAAAAQVLDKLGISIIPTAAACCGALPQHLSQPGKASDMMRHTIDLCWPQVENGIEAIISTASGCGVHLKDYGTLLADDPDYAEKAAKIAALSKDIAEILQNEDLTPLNCQPHSLAFHAPCTLQHGQQLNGLVENILTRAGFSLTPVTDSHLCCGSAGTYSLLHPELADRLRHGRIQALQAGHPQVIATANIGCLLHLQEKTALEVKHWIELLQTSSTS